jgi:MoaA/NifB/PqqE/SkfB family radical SAM enzyme
MIGIPSAARIIFSRLAPASPAVNIPAVINTLNDTGRTFCIGITGTGGEPFLVSNVVELCVELTKKHYIALFTNMTSKKIREFAEKVKPEKVLLMHASCHIKELERLNLFDNYISNFLLCREKGFMPYAIARAHPPLSREAKKYKEYFKKKGIELKFAMLSGKFGKKQYPESYTEEELRIFGLEKAAYLELYRSFGRICNAGYNVAVASTTGDVVPCYGVKESMGNLHKKIVFRKDKIKCPRRFCMCPICVYAPDLFYEVYLSAVA